MGLFSLEKRRLRGNLINVYKYLKGKCVKNRARLFSVVPSDRTRGSEHKLKHRRFSLKIREHFFTVKVTDQWHRLPNMVVDLPPWRYPKAIWTWSWVTSFMRPCLSRVDGNLGVPSNLNHYVILWF